MDPWSFDERRGHNDANGVCDCANLPDQHQHLVQFLADRWQTIRQSDHHSLVQASNESTFADCRGSHADYILRRESQYLAVLWNDVP